MAQRYLIGLGSNVPHHRHGPPRQVLRAAFDAIREAGISLVAVSPVIATTPIGPSHRRFANAAAVVRTPLAPPELLERLASIERSFGRRSGQRWGARVLDLDIVMWEGGAWSSPGLTVPHIAFRERNFVLGPAVKIAWQWRDPLTGLTVRQLHARLTRPRPVPR